MIAPGAAHRAEVADRQKRMANSTVESMVELPVGTNDSALLGMRELYVNAMWRAERQMEISHRDVMASPVRRNVAQRAITSAIQSLRMAYDALEEYKAVQS